MRVIRSDSSSSGDADKLTPVEREQQALAADTRREPSIPLVLIGAFAGGAMTWEVGRVTAVIVGLGIFGLGMWLRNVISGKSKARA